MKIATNSFSLTVRIDGDDAAPRRSAYNHQNKRNHERYQQTQDIESTIIIIFLRAAQLSHEVLLSELLFCFERDWRSELELGGRCML